MQEMSTVSRNGGRNDRDLQLVRRQQNGSESPKVVIPTWLGDLSHLEPYSSTVCSDHAEELRKYFRIGGIEAFGKSTSAGMLASAELYACGSRPCLRCGGRLASDDDVESERGGCGFVPSGSERNRAVSRKQAEFLALLDIACETIPVSGDTPCPECGCRGWVPARFHAESQITARPMGSSVDCESFSDGTDIDMQILGICSRRLERADCLLPICSTVLASQFEPGSSGVMGAWHLTPAGKTWLRKNTLGLQPAQFFAAARIAQESNHDAGIELVIQACDAQSLGLLDAAGRAWNASVHSESEAGQ
jgi:hypothetical protein